MVGTRDVLWSGHAIFGHIANLILKSLTEATRRRHFACCHEDGWWNEPLLDLESIEDSARTTSFIHPPAKRWSHLP